MPLSDLPDPPSGKVGWPWTVPDPKQDSLANIDFESLPVISVITPSYNQAEYVEETIRSVLLQGYPKLQYIILDGGSEDGSVEIIQKYESWLSYWVSEKDNGQADAIMRGFEYSNGELICWINSDDMLMPYALVNYVDYYIKNKRPTLLVGGAVLIDQNGLVVCGKKGVPRFNRGHDITFNRILWAGFHFNQPSTIWRRDAFFEVGGFDRNLFFSFDYDMYLRLTLKDKGHSVGRITSAYRLHSDTKTTKYVDVCMAENAKLHEKYGRSRVNKIIGQFMLRYYNGWSVWRWRLDVLGYKFGVIKVDALDLFKRCTART